MSFSIAAALASLLARGPGAILRCSSLKFRVISFLLCSGAFSKVFGIQLVGAWHVDVVPPIVSALVATGQQDCGSLRIESVQDPVWPAGVLNPQLPHLGIAALCHAGTVREAQVRTQFLKQDYGSVDAPLLVRREPDSCLLTSDFCLLSSRSAYSYRSTSAGAMRVALRAG